MTSMALYWAFRVAARALCLLPQRVGYALGRGGGIAAFYLWRGGRRRCIRNMLHVTGGDAARARACARSSFAHYGCYLVDFLRFERMTAQDVRRRFQFDGWPLVDAARAGNGIVFVTLHFGNWDVAAAALAEHGLPVSVLAERFGNARLDRAVVQARERLGMQVVPADRMGPGILRALQRDDVVALLIDVPQPGGGVGVEVAFFGGTIVVPDGPARIALRAGAPIVAATAPRLGPWSDCYRGEVEVVAFTPSGDREQDARALTQATMHALEDMVRRAPEQWYIFRSLWPADRGGGEAG